jgi:DASH family cryptochrome
LIPTKLLDDLPFPLSKLPNNYTQFRAKVENPKAPIRQSLDLVHKHIKPFPRQLLSSLDGDIKIINVAKEVINPLSEKLFHALGGGKPYNSTAVLDVVSEALCRDKSNPQSHPTSAFPFEGGESSALDHWRSYLESKKVDTYKKTRNGLIGVDYSTKLSPFLSLGLISPRKVLHDLQAYEATQGPTYNTEGTYWVWFELLWRDYFKFMALKHGSKIFALNGFKQESIHEWKSGNHIYGRAWSTGVTGVPFVDANMRELIATGFMSNRGRQNVASFLSKGLGVDWRFGAELFESLLIDHGLYFF